MKASPFGLITHLANARVHLPLIHIETRFQVAGDTMVVEMDQIFEQNAREPLDVTYTFPLPASAAVYRCEMLINDRLVRAVVMEEKKAREVVAEKKAEGRRTALVEMDRENLFTLQLGNVAPGDRIVIRFAYMEALDRLGNQLSLRVPFSPGVRYIPGKPLLRTNRGKGTEDDTNQVPDASRLSPPRIGSDHPDLATMYLCGAFTAGEVELRTLESPTHPAVIRSIGGRVEVELADEEHFPGGDFVLRWEEPATTEPVSRCWVTTHDGHTYALLQVRAPLTNSVAAEENLAQDFYFLLDRSGSMAGMKWEKCAEALQAFVAELGPKDRIWITCFESSYQDFSDELMRRDDLLADQAFQNLANLGTDGGTEILPALEHLLRIRKTQDRHQPARLILITDGQVGNEPEILRRMQQPDAARFPVHCFGIDDAVNDAFLKSLARDSGGRCTMMTPNDDIPGAVKRLGQTLRRPLLTNITLAEALEPSDERWTLPDLHAGEVSLVAIRCAAGKTGTTLSANLRDGAPWTQPFQFNLGTASELPRLVWTQRRCSHLIGQRRQTEAVELAIAHNLLCDGTSFVAWDEIEKVSVAKREVYQPSAETEFNPGLLSKKLRRRTGAGAAAPNYGPVSKYLSVSPPAPAPCMSAPCLTECSDEDVAPLMAAGAPPPPRQKPLSLSGGMNPDQIASLEAWGNSLWEQLEKAGLRLAVISAVIRIMLRWSTAILSHTRQDLLAALVETLEKSDSPLDQLRTFISTHVQEPDRKKLFEALTTEQETV